MGKTTHVVEVKTQVTGGKSVDKLTKNIKGAGVAGKTAGTGVAVGFKAATASIVSAIPALRAFTVALASTGVGLIVVALGALVGLFTSAGRKGADFEKALSGLQAVTGETAEEIAVLSDQAKDLGASTAFTASQVVSLQTELAKLGFTLIDIQNATPAILDLAASLDVSLAEAATFAGSTVRAFGLTTEDTLDVVNVLAKSTTKSALNFSLLQESLKLVAPTAKAVGISLRDTTTLLGVLADNGIKGSRAGTGLSRALTELNAKGLTLNDAYKKINNSSNKLITATELVGTVGGRALLTLAANTPAIETLSDALNDVDDAARKIAETRLDNLAGDMTKLGSAWEGFLLNIEDGTGVINKLSRGAIKFLTSSIGAFQEAIEYTGFFWNEFTTDLKLGLEESKIFWGSGFSILGNTIKKFANLALLEMSKIPILGRAIDKEAVKKNIEEAVKAIDDAELEFERRREIGRLREQNNISRYGRWILSQLTRQKDLEDKKIKSLAGDGDLTDPETGETEEEKKARLLKKAFLDKLKKSEEDQNASTALEKNELAKQRHLDELDKLGLEHTEKKELIARIDALYADKAAIIKEEADLKEAEEGERLEQEKRDRRNKTFDEAVALAGAESRLGKAILLAKAILNVKEGIMDAKALIMKAKQAMIEAKLKGANAGVEITGSVAKGANTAPPPYNIPFILAAIATGIGIIASVKQAISATKSVASSVGGAGGGGGSSLQTPSAPPISAPPAFNVVGASDSNQLAGAIASQSQTPIKTYVVASDVTTGQALERNTIEGASIG